VGEARGRDVQVVHFMRPLHDVLHCGYALKEKKRQLH
jgi:hypothetical protein